MGRVNVETRALAETRFIHLAEDLDDGGRVGAIGLLVIFWHDTQERGLVEGTREEIQKLIPYRTDEAKRTTFELLVRHDYVKQIGDRYEISGNRKQVDAFSHLKKIARIGGVKSGKARRKQAHRTDASKIEPPASSREDNSIQFNSIQSNTDQLNSIQNNTTQKEGIHPLVQIWNDGCGGLPQVRELSTARRKKANALGARYPNPEDWQEVMKRIRSSPFLTGQSDRGWKANFDWLLRPETVTKILEGQYDSSPTRKQTFAEVREQSHKELWEKIETGEA